MATPHRDRNLESLMEFVRALGASIKVKHVKAPGVTNARDAGLREHYMMELCFVDLESTQPVVAEATWTPTRDDFKLGRWWQILPMTLNEQDHKGFARYAREARGFTVVTITEPMLTTDPAAKEVKHWGRAICSTRDTFKPYIGTARALRMALDQAALAGTPLGMAWLDRLAATSKSRAARIDALKRSVLRFDILAIPTIPTITTTEQKHAVQ